MIEKKTFCKVIDLIREQDKINEDFSRSLESVADGNIVFGAHNKYLDALLIVLREDLNDKFDYIGWWLYEEPSDYKISTVDGTQEWVLDTAEKLYDFIVGENK